MKAVIDDMEKSLINLFESANLGLSLDSEDVCLIAEVIKDYQFELAMKDKDIEDYKQQVEILQETVNIYKDITTGYENSYRNIKG